MDFTTSGQETEWAYSYSPGAHTGLDVMEFGLNDAWWAARLALLQQRIPDKFYACILVIDTLTTLSLCNHIQTVSGDIVRIWHKAEILLYVFSFF